MFCKMGLRQLLSGDPQCVSRINTCHLTMCMACVYRYLISYGYNHKEGYVAELVEHQDPNAIRYH